MEWQLTASADGGCYQRMIETTFDGNGGYTTEVMSGWMPCDRRTGHRVGNVPSWGSWNGNLPDSTNSISKPTKFDVSGSNYDTTTTVGTKKTLGGRKSQTKVLEYDAPLYLERKTKTDSQDNTSTTSALGQVLVIVGVIALFAFFVEKK